MKLDFSQGNVTLVIVPHDLRSGYKKLASIAFDYFHIDVSLKEDWVVFISKTKSTCKIIKADDHGSILITRALNTGKFQQLLARAGGIAAEPLTVKELELYLDGEDLLIKRTNPFKG